ncbi:Kti12, chromatin associated [Malassezia pachydermatis]
MSVRIVWLTLAQRTEGRARAAYLSAVRRALSPSTIVIADGGAGLNIKGSRYELWCATRELGLRCATLYVACTPDLSRTWNTQRRTRGEATYTDACWDELLMRFEEPSSSARWHRPLFTTIAAGTPEALECTPTPLAPLWEAMTQGDVQPPKAVTAIRKKTTNNSLEMLDTVTQLVLTALSEYRAQGGVCEGRILLPMPSSIPPPPIVLTLPAMSTFPSPARLQTLRRQFVRVYASKAEYAENTALTSESSPERHIAELFTQWLQEALSSATKIHTY